MPKIDEIRDKIDNIDEKLLQLFNRRAKLAMLRTAADTLSRRQAGYRFETSGE